MEATYELKKVEKESDWSTYHDIRRIVLFEEKGRFGLYNGNHPDEKKKVTPHFC